MPKKILKIILILMVMLSLHITYVLASDINLNLPGTDINQVDDNTQVTNEEVVNQDTSASNTNNQENVDNSGDKYDTYRFDLNWVYDDKSLEFNKSNKSLKELIELVIVDASVKKSKFSFLANIIYAISSLFR